jgi:hypothetical protein
MKRNFKPTVLALLYGLEFTSFVTPKGVRTLPAGYGEDYPTRRRMALRWWARARQRARREWIKGF